VVLGLAPRAVADVTITYPSVGSYGFSSQNTPYTASQSVQKFDPSLGTLISMQFTVSETVSGTVSLWSPDASQTVSEVDYNGFIYATLPGGGSTLADGTHNLIVLNEADSDAPLITTTTDIPQNGNSGSPPSSGTVLTETFSGLNQSSTTYTFDSSTSADEEANSFSGGSLLSDFTGTGTTSVNLTALAQVSTTTSGDVLSAYSDNVTGTLSVTYDYTPNETAVAPEPGTWLSAGLLFGMVGFSTGRSLWLKRAQPIK